MIAMKYSVGKRELNKKGQIELLVIYGAFMVQVDNVSWLRSIVKK